ncbi:MAG: hypothetical protein QM661_06435 [Solimonas sp.]
MLTAGLPIATWKFDGDDQAMQMYKGYGARLLFQRDIELAVPRARHALERFEAIAAAQADGAAKARWATMARRVQALSICCARPTTWCPIRPSSTA